MIHFISKSIFYLLGRLLFGLEVYGKENIPKKGGFILASNHVSLLDPPFVGCVCPRKLNYMAKDELFKNPLSSFWLKSVGAFPVKRNTGDFHVLRDSIHKLRDGKAMLLFPEGARQKPEDRNDKAEQGVGFLAMKANVPVIPAFIKGSEKALPKGAKSLKLVKIQVYFGSPIDISKETSYEDAAQLILNMIRQMGVSKENVS